MRHPSHSKFCTRAIHSLTHSPAPTARALLPTPARPARAAHYVLRVVDKSNGFSPGGADYTRGPARLSEQRRASMSYACMTTS